jgi:hypothetical protein
LQQQASSAEAAANKKIQKVRHEMESQLKGFVDQQDKMAKAAFLVEINADTVDKVLSITLTRSSLPILRCAWF